MRNTDTAGTLNDRDARIVALKVAGMQPAAIATEIGTAVSTIYRRLNDPHVRVAVTEMRADEVRPLVFQALGEVRRSVDKLVEIRDGGATRDAERIRAAVAILTWFKDVHEMAEVLPRLASIEARLAAVQCAGGSADHTDQRTPHEGPAPPGMVADDDTEVV